MYKKLRIVILFLLACHVSIFATKSETQILKKIETTMYPEYVNFTATLTIKRPQKTHMRKMRIFLNGTTQSLIEMLEPVEEKNTRMLRINDNNWIYLPSVEKVIRLSGGTRLAGSDFLYDDILRIKLSGDYIVQFSGSDSIGSFLVLKRNSNIAIYEKIILWYDAKSFIPIQQNFYADSDILLKSMIYSHLKNFGGRVVPSRIDMTLANSKDFLTTLDILDYNDILNIPERVFSKSYLRMGM